MFGTLIREPAFNLLDLASVAELGHIKTATIGPVSSKWTKAFIMGLVSIACSREISFALSGHNQQTLSYCRLM